MRFLGSVVAPLGSCLAGASVALVGILGLGLLREGWSSPTLWTLLVLVSPLRDGVCTSPLL